ncbi:MAG: dynamin family protein [Pseudomonadota bacterium]
MTDTACPTQPVTPIVNKPRIALMGEFSAGKSTLANLLLEQQSSPVQVTATQLPPIWYRLGHGEVHRISLDGTREQIPNADWSTTSTKDVQMIEIGLQAETLHSADLIDMPGTSDPNLEIPYWKTVLPQVDIVVWCTPANQAWRQSEAALWDDVPDALKPRSLLLITRMDQIRNATDRDRILQRVRHEVQGSFAEVLPVSLTQAMTAEDDDCVLEASGAADMVRFLLSVLDGVGDKPRPDYVPYVPPKEPAFEAHDRIQTAPTSIIRRIVPRRAITRRLSPN